MGWRDPYCCMALPHSAIATTVPAVAVHTRPTQSIHELLCHEWLITSANARGVNRDAASPIVQPMTHSTPRNPTSGPKPELDTRIDATPVFTRHVYVSMVLQNHERTLTSWLAVLLPANSSTSPSKEHSLGSTPV
jgi:hypothetical protein